MTHKLEDVSFMASRQQMRPCEQEDCAALLQQTLLKLSLTYSWGTRTEVRRDADSSFHHVNMFFFKYSPSALPLSPITLTFAASEVCYF